MVLKSAKVHWFSAGVFVVVLVAVVCNCLCCVEAYGASADKSTTGYSFILDGKPYEPRIISLNGTPDKPCKGDVLFVNEIAMVLDKPGSYSFRSTPKDDGLLLLVGNDGDDKVIGAQVDWTYRDKRKVVFNPFATLSTDQIKGLRGIRLNSWPDGLTKKLGYIDLNHTCVTITDDTATGRRSELPPLPEGLLYLNIDESSSMGVKDYNLLRKQSQLRFFALNAMGEDAFDVKMISANRQLRFLDLGGEDLMNVQTLANFTNLRELHLEWCPDVDNIRFVRDMTHLKVLWVRNSSVMDMTPLAGLKELTIVNADQTPVSRLPEGEFDCLSMLRIMSTKVTENEIARFCKANPQCEVHYRWDESLRRSLKGITRIRVRSGGTCHRDKAAERTLFEETNPGKIEMFTKRFAINEGGSGFHCMCCGSPSFEFYNNEELVVTLGFHHGRSLRWPEGWPSDALMTGEFADYVCKWLAENGVSDPQKEREDEQKREIAMQRRQQLYIAIIPQSIMRSLSSATSKEAAVSAFEKGMPDHVRRAELYLHLFGCDNGSWNQYSGLDELLQKDLLPKIADSRLATAIRNSLNHKAAANGAARWLFGEGKWKALDERTLSEVLPALSECGLSHPREVNRRRTLVALKGIGTASAAKLLRKCFAGQVQVVSLSKDEQIEPGGMVSFTPQDGSLPGGVSDRAVAALFLAQMNDRTLLAEMRNEVKRAGDEDKKLLQEAIDILTRSD